MSTVMKKVGDINERGYLNGFTRRGYTPAKCLLELVANILDSMDKLPRGHSFPRKAVFDVKPDFIRLIDNALGMNEENIENMFSLHRENHAGEPSRGVSGIGSKPAQYILSGQTDVNIFTHTPGHNYYRVYVPWADIETSGVYTGKVKVYEMTHAERDKFVSERADNDMLDGQDAHGTTVEFQHNDSLETLIHNTMNSVKGNQMNNPLDRCDIVFGRENIQIVCKEPTGYKEMSFYNYFGAPNSQFYTGISTHTIQQWSKKNEDRFIWVEGDESLEVPKHGSGYSKDIKPMQSNLLGYTQVGDFKVQTGLRIDPEYFDYANPKIPENNTVIYAYDNKYLGKDEHDTLAQLYLNRIKLVRNNMLIGLIPTPDVAVGSSRANYRANLEYARVQVEVSFNPVSSQNNPQDRVMGIQENKNQFDGEAVPKNLTRLLKEMRKRKADQIHEYFERVIQGHNGDFTTNTETTTEPAPIKSTTITNQGGILELMREHADSVVSSVSMSDDSATSDSNDEKENVFPSPSNISPSSDSICISSPPPARNNRFTIDLTALDQDNYENAFKELKQILEKYSLSMN